MSTPDRKLFQQAVQLYKQGDKEGAHKYMRKVLLEDPTYVPAWLWMSALVDDIDQQRECLERALALDPNSEPAIRGLKILRLRETAEAKETADSRQMNETREAVKAHLNANQDTAVPMGKNEQPSSSSTLDMDFADQRQAGKIGEYLVEQGLITRKQLEMALEEQRLFWKKSQGVRAPLGNILINNGMLTPQMLATALVTQQHDKLHGREKQTPQYVGEYLVSRGLISEQQLESVLAEQLRLRQKGTTMLLGELLIHAGYITREALETVLEQQRDELFSRFGFED